MGYIRDRGVIYAAPHNAHPNSHPELAVRIDVNDFHDLLDVAYDVADHDFYTPARELLLSAGWVEHQVLSKFITCMTGMQTVEETILHMIRGYYQAVKQQKCRVHFYVRDWEKEHEIANYLQER